MQAQVFQANYETLSRIRSMFEEMAETTETLAARMRKANDVMMGESEGDWADKYEAEMNTIIWPTLSRLQNALTESAQTIQEISDTVSEAEERAAAIFGIAGGLRGIAGIAGGALRGGIAGVRGSDLRGFAGGGGGGGGGGAYGDEEGFNLLDWLRNGDNTLGFTDTGAETLRNLLIKSGGALKINQFLLDHMPELKPEWMQFLRENEGGSLIDGAIGALLKPDHAGLELGGGITKAGLAHFFADKLSSAQLGGAFEVVDGAVKALEEGDPKYLLSGGIKGLISLNPYGRAALIANSGIQFVGEGVGMIVHTGSDWLSNGDPEVAEGFRQQSDSFRSALRDMDLEDAIDSTSEGIIKFAQGDFSGSWDSIKGGGETFISGVGNTGFESVKLSTTLYASAFEKVTGIDTSNFIKSVQNYTTDDLAADAGKVYDSAKTAISNTVDDVGHRLDQAGKDLNRLTDQVGDAVEKFKFW